MSQKVKHKQETVDKAREAAIVLWHHGRKGSAAGTFVNKLILDPDSTYSIKRFFVLKTDLERAADSGLEDFEKALDHFVRQHVEVVSD